ncbi:methyl-accepting chemotaxis protein [Pelagibaculum spongiae]|uniref:Methyl-accepting chemotaxis protein n=1 Tax=Pelagibaculum spongiae TaxID=2080658 RepID=A0A2V1GV69_9GAMM|nr:methyl-accepting chemotaxis protein [Pelagibaculum spongiae]PVZ70295.1 hypothetical protein DC094_06770 [Pelagibaculum spongiae]
MRVLMTMTVKKRLFGLVFIALAMMAGLSVSALVDQKNLMRQERIGLLATQLETMDGVIDQQLKSMQASGIPIDKSLNMTFGQVSKYRYSKGSGYFIILDRNYQLRATRDDSTLLGTNVANWQDSHGRRIFKDMWGLVDNGENYIEYYYPKNSGGEPHPKATLLKYLPKLDMVLATGVYIDDIDALFYSKLRTTLLIIGLLAIAFIAVSLAIAKSITMPLQMMVGLAQKSAAGDLTHRLNSCGKSELCQLADAFNSMLESMSALVKQLGHSTNDLDSTISDVTAVAEQTNRNARNESQEVDNIASAVEEMAAAIAEVDRNITQSADATETCNQLGLQTGQKLDKASDSISLASQQIGQAETVVLALREGTEKINEVLSVINQISEQTNLLALNAAIEAARAGESGRGFAVVADEVRVLAQNTRQSTTEIQGIIEQLQSQANQAAEVMQTSSTSTRESVEVVAESSQQLQQVLKKLSFTSGLGQQISASATEQTAVAEEISRNLVNISGMSRENLSGCDQTLNSCHQVADLAEKLRKEISRYRC